MAQRVVDHGDTKKYWTQIPNIVFTLGLSPYEFALYCHLKRTAGADGICWKSTATLARETGMSGGMVSKAKVALQGQFSLLGKPLITVSEEPNQKGGKPKHCISLTDIWGQNFKLRGSSSQGEAETQPSSPHEHATSHSERASSPHEQPSSPGEIKNNSLEEKPSEEKKEPSAHALLMEFHASQIKGPIPDGAAQGAAVKWLLTYYARDALEACYRSQVAETWRAKVSWLTVKSEIGSWLSRSANGSSSKHPTNRNSTSGDYEFKPKSIIR